MNIAETLEYITKVQWRERKPGLDRIKELLAALGNPEKKQKYIHVAGTNGKGSTSACLASILKHAGFKTGLFISPYVIRYNERMQFNGEYITDEELIQLTERLRVIADAMEDPPTVYEITTALGFMFFEMKGCDIAVLEVGMGGELDATNVIDCPEVAVITTIGYDHVEELGPTLVDIASAKAGIIKKDGNVVIYPGAPEVEDVFRKISNDLDARFRKADFKRISNQQLSYTGNTFECKPYGEITVSLAGSYQVYNATVAITAIEMLRDIGYEISDDEIKKGLANVYWPGRFEVLGEDPVFILDGAHNPEGMQVTADSLRYHFRGKPVVFIIGVMADKDLDNMVPHVIPLALAFVTCKPDYEGRAMEADVLAEKLLPFGAPVTISESFDDAVAKAIKLAGKDGIICTVGSLYFSHNLRDAYNKSQGIKSDLQTGGTVCYG